MTNREYLKRWRKKHPESANKWHREHPILTRRYDNKWHKLQYAVNTDLINILKMQECVDCKKVFPPYVMDFDHRNRKSKYKCVFQLKIGSLDTLLKEIEKCDLVCANCHRLRTWGKSVRKSFENFIQSAQPQQLLYTNGKS